MLTADQRASVRYAQRCCGAHVTAPTLHAPAATKQPLHKTWHRAQAPGSLHSSPTSPGIHRDVIATVLPRCSPLLYWLCLSDHATLRGFRSVQHSTRRRDAKPLLTVEISTSNERSCTVDIRTRREQTPDRALVCLDAAAVSRCVDVVPGEPLARSGSTRPGHGKPSARFISKPEDTEVPEGTEHGVRSMAVSVGPAARAGVSRARCAVNFREVVRMKPGSYLGELRMGQARHRRAQLGRRPQCVRRTRAAS